MTLIPSPSQTFRQLYGAWRTFWLDRRGLVLFENTPEACVQSFWCAVVVLPMVLVLRLLQSDYGATVEANSALRLASVEITGYVIQWTIWPVLAEPLSRFLQRRDQYYRYICALNWITAPLILLFVLVTVIVVIFPLPVIAIRAITLCAVLWSMVLHSYILKNGLQVPMITAIPIVIVEFFLGQTILLWRESLLGNVPM